MKQNYSHVLVAIAVILLAVQVVMLYSMTSADSKEISLSASDRLLLQSASNRSVPMVPSYNESKLDEILNEVSEDEDADKESLALKLSSEELNSSEVKKSVRKTLNDEMDDSEFAGSEIESWRDVSFSIRSDDIEVDDEDATVELLVDVVFYLDGTNDSEKARMKITFNVEELEDSDAEAYFTGHTLVRFL